MREVDAFVLWIADACAFSVNVVPSKIKHFNAGVEVFAARTFEEGKADRSYIETPVCHNLSPREHARKMYADGAPKVDVAR